MKEGHTMNETTTTDTTSPSALLGFVSLVEVARERRPDLDGKVAEVWGVTPSDTHGLTGHRAHLITTNADIYDALDSLHGDPFDGGGEISDEDFDALAAVVLVTFGWAAPIPANGDEYAGAPSEHPERRRVRLIAAAARGEAIASRLAFLDVTTGEVIGDQIDDEGDARGPLAEALAAIFD